MCIQVIRALKKALKASITKSDEFVASSTEIEGDLHDKMDSYRRSVSS
jgi:hypothetical protein